MRTLSAGGLFILVLAGSLGLAAADVIALGDKRELFVDRQLVDRLDGLTLELKEPRVAPVEGVPPYAGAYATVLYVDGVYHYYYRVKHAAKDAKGQPVYGYYYLRSADGIRWEMPNLGLFPSYGKFARNMILEPHDPITHNFSPFVDTRPGVPAGERFKAVAGGGKSWSAGEGLYGLVSADGVHWRKIQEGPIFAEAAAGEHPFDGQNVAFWSEAEQQYVCYYRTSWQAAPRGWTRSKRGISRSTSKDFIHWTQGREIDVNLPEEQFYTNQTAPYFRAPHIYLALPWRYLPSGPGNIHRYPSDTVLMTSRGGDRFDRTFPEALIRPGRHAARWDPAAPRAVSTALNIVPTGEDEMSVYVGDMRYAFRVDGLASLHADMAYGEMRTKPFTFDGEELEVNFSTSAAGRVHVGLETADGEPISGFSVEDCEVLVGDEISQRVTWKGGRNLGSLRGKPLRLVVKMRDADLYSFRFRQAEQKTAVLAGNQ